LYKFWRAYGAIMELLEGKIMHVEKRIECIHRGGLGGGLGVVAQCPRGVARAAIILVGRDRNAVGGGGVQRGWIK
jgi:hypothetical protein